MTVSKRISVLILTAALALSLASCGESPKAQSESSEAQSSEQSIESGTAESSGPAESAKNADTLSLTDREGREITVTDKVEKIISMAPSVTQTLVNLGLGDKIIAIDSYSAGIEGLKEGLAEFDMMTPDTEKMAALKPDLILATGMSTTGTSDDPFKPLTELGIVMSYIPSSTSIEGIKEDIRFLGTVTGTVKRAEEIILDMQKEIDEIVALVPKDSGKKVYFEVAAAPEAYSFGKGTFLNEIIKLLGAENIMAEEEGWLSVSEEIILGKNPDVIFTSVDYVEDPVGEILSRKAWAPVTAVKDKQVFKVDTNKSTLPNEYITGAMEEMAKALYPESFKP